MTKRIVAGWILVAFALVAPFSALAQRPQSVTLSIPKMYCVACELTVKKALKKVPGVENVDVDLKSKTAVVQFDADGAGTADLIQATTKAGFAGSVKQ